MAGFDLYPGQVDSGGYVVEGAGINNTHYGNIFQVVRTAVTNTPTVNVQIGVSGQAAHKMSPGSAIERNGLLIKRMGNSNTGCYIRNRTALPAPPEGNYIGIAFTYKVLPGINTGNSDLPQVSWQTATSPAIVNLLMIRSSAVDTNVQLRFFNTLIPTTTLPYLTIGREYHIEVRMIKRAGTAAGIYDYQLLVDGDSIITVSYSETRFATEGVVIQTGVSTTNGNYSLAVLISDLILATWEPGLFTTGIGPQLVLASKVASVTPGNWEKEGNATPTETLSDQNDTTYYASPTDAGAMSAKVAGALTPFKALAAEVLVRASRDRDAGRVLTAELRKSDGSGSLAPATNIATGNGYNGYMLQRLEGIAEADIRTPTVRLNATVP